MDSMLECALWVHTLGGPMFNLRPFKSSLQGRLRLLASSSST
jgi:hypothetical protein